MSRGQCLQRTLASLERLNLGLRAGDISRDKWVRLGKRMISNQ